MDECSQSRDKSLGEALNLLPRLEVPAFHHDNIGLKLLSKISLTWRLILLVLKRVKILLVELVKVVFANCITSVRKGLLSQADQTLRQSLQGY